MNRPYSLDYARLASGAFYETIILVTFNEIIKIRKQGKISLGELQS
jgi:hypothetical protein